MSFEKSFCSSPWFHMRIDSDGTLRYCRWLDRDKDRYSDNIGNTDIKTFFQQKISGLRKQMLEGTPVDSCHKCKEMETHNKVSGRQKQLLKTGIRSENFVSTIKSSTFINEFEKSYQQNGDTNLMPQDWQIDLGNFCNSACIFCGPNNSSRLATEFKKLGLITKLPKKNWADNPVMLESFIEILDGTKNIAYLHFLGGETIITPAFKKILKKLIERGLNKTASIGLTTNLTVWEPEIIKLLTQFKEINLGMSIECFHEVNDYLRWPSKINEVKEILEKWLRVAAKHKWLIQLRTTPTVFSIAHLKNLYEYAFKKNIGIESCNFLTEPAVMKISLLPYEIRQKISTEIQGWVDLHKNYDKDEQIVNTRDKNQVRQYILQDATSYINYMKNVPEEPHLWQDLVVYLKKLESSRKNSILDYAPEYEKFLRAAGY
jgi:MoaA/NifB/PqqE/SkfB family radical SAM enzyme